MTLGLPYWIADTLTATPAFVWMYFGVGIPCALVVLPKRDWRRTLEVIALAIPLGALVVTGWMFALGTLAGEGTPLLRADLVIGGSIIIALIGAAVAFAKARAFTFEEFELPPRTRLALDERVLILVIAAALMVRWIVIAYWPFTIYDALWVYGYQGKLYTLIGHIPDAIGYYPQFLSLQYTYGQLAFGAVSDHAARAGLAILHAGAILAAYVLGSRAAGRRVGIYAAALWGLYPHLGDWSRGGDLEVLTGQLFTLAAAYFLTAWLADTARGRRRYAVIAGLLLGIGLWTKPTMGAFIWGVGVLVAVTLVRVRFDMRRARPALEVALITGAACIPVGGMWYIRNLLLGHAVVDFPPDFWLTQAARSGVEFGWPLLFAGVALSGLLIARPRVRPKLPGILIGVGLIALALVPSIVAPRRLVVTEYGVLLAGIAALAATTAPLWRRWHPVDRRIATFCLAGAGLALPYFATWFWSYSYHFRLSFAIVPLLALPTAVIVARWTDKWRPAGRRLWTAALVVCSLPGIISAVYDTYMGWDYLFTDVMPDDHVRYASGNPALMTLVDGLQIWRDEHPGEPLAVAAPAVDRLPFFFPLEPIDVDSAPTRLEALADTVYFVYGAPESVGAYEHIPPLENQVVGALGRVDTLRRAWGQDDGIFRYDIYELHLGNRFVRPMPNGPALDEVIVGGWGRYLGYDIGGLDLWPGRRVIFHTYWEVLAPPERDWMMYVHLLDAGGNLVATWDGPINPTPLGYYSTQLWEPGEFVMDERVISLPESALAAVAGGYRLVVGFYDFTSNERVPMTIDGAEADGYTVEDRIAILAAPPGG